MSTAQQVYRMLGNENLWQVAIQCHRALQESQIQHSVCGGVAVCLHGYQRNTVDLDLIIRRAENHDNNNSGHSADFVPGTGGLSSERNVNTTDCLDSVE